MCQHVALGACLAILLTGETSQAENRVFPEPDTNLGRLQSIHVTFSQTTPDAATCGLQVAGYRRLIENTLTAGGLEINPSPETLAVLSVMTSHSEEQQSCGSATMLGVYRLISFFDEVTGSLEQGYIVLWHQGQQVISSAASHSDAVIAAISQLSDKFLESWRAENKNSTQR